MSDQEEKEVDLGIWSETYSKKTEDKIKRKPKFVGNSSLPEDVLLSYAQQGNNKLTFWMNNTINNIQTRLSPIKFYYDQIQLVKVM